MIAMGREACYAIQQTVSKAVAPAITNTVLNTNITNINIIFLRRYP